MSSDLNSGYRTVTCVRHGETFLGHGVIPSKERQQSGCVVVYEPNIMRVRDRLRLAWRLQKLIFAELVYVLSAGDMRTRRQLDQRRKYVIATINERGE